MRFFGDSVARYTRYVIFGRSLLWMLIACMVGAVVWIAGRDRGPEGSRLVFTNMPQSENLKNEMVKPHYQGLDSRNNPYTVVAENALQKDADTVVLKSIRADMQQADGTWLALDAGDGELMMESRKMNLTGGVNMFYEGGYEFEADHAQVDIDKGTAYGETPVKGQGPIGTLTADGFSVEDRGRIIRFHGSVKLKLYP